MKKEGLMKVLLSPIISEKSAIAADTGRQYLFRVDTGANKQDIRRAVELMFNVNVDRVQVVNVKGKAKRFGRTMGKRPRWKKAYVRLKEGQDIQFDTGM